MESAKTNTLPLDVVSRKKSFRISKKKDNYLKYTIVDCDIKQQAKTYITEVVCTQ
jgi:hypothetical protein